MSRRWSGAAVLRLIARDAPDDGTVATPYQFGIDQGPVALMIENYRIWSLMRRCPPIVAGLRRAGFTGGWLSQSE
jgi:hypothetical protein